jgi:hypothetical protein
VSFKPLKVVKLKSIIVSFFNLSDTYVCSKKLLQLALNIISQFNRTANLLGAEIDAAAIQKVSNILSYYKLVLQILLVCPKVLKESLKKNIKLHQDILFCDITQLTKPFRVCLTFSLLVFVLMQFEFQYMCHLNF